MSNDTTPTKTCTVCGQVFPATLEHFHKRKEAPDGLRCDCKTCYKKRQHDRYIANRTRIREKERKYQQENKERITEYRRRHYQENKERIKAKQRERNKQNRDKLSEQSRRYYLANPDKFRIYSMRREARKRALPDTFTQSQWITCLEYHHYVCAVCGNQLRDLFGNIEPHADHWIALSHPDCPGTIAKNMICLCSECNLSKQDTPPDVWLERKYGKRKAEIILAKVEAYFASLEL